MGGWGSGRHSGRPTVEDGLTIDVARMVREGWIGEGRANPGELHWSRRGERFATIGYRADLIDPEAASLALRYTWTPHGGEPRSVEQHIALTSTSPNYGGRRWWFVCPFSGRRVGKLHLPPGGGKFASREAWRLSYRSQRDAHRDRPFEKLFRLQRKLGGPEGWDGWLTRPKGMHLRTFDRHFDRYLALSRECDAAMGVMYAKLRGRGLDL